MADRATVSEFGLAERRLRRPQGTGHVDLRTGYLEATSVRPCSHWECSPSGRHRWVAWHGRQCWGKCNRQAWLTGRPDTMRIARIVPCPARHNTTGERRRHIGHMSARDVNRVRSTRGIVAHHPVRHALATTWTTAAQHVNTESTQHTVTLTVRSHQVVDGAALTFVQEVSPSPVASSRPAI